MLRVDRGEEAWLVTQPDHAAVAGYLAAHWGRGAFAQPGHFAPCPSPERLRAETVLGIAQHDNGWLETEALPALSERGDGIPAGLEEHQRDPEAGFTHWRRGVARHADAHPYVALLIACHALGLQRPRVAPETLEPGTIHPFFWRALPPPLHGAARGRAVRFLEEVEASRAALAGRLGTNPDTAAWIEPANLLPHLRLLQLTDALSLSLCAAVLPPSEGESAGLGLDAFPLFDVPRQSWDDRVTLAVMPAGERRLVCEPYPFDLDPLPVPVPVRIVHKSERRPGELASWWYGMAPTTVTFTYASA